MCCTGERSRIGAPEIGTPQVAVIVLQADVFPSSALKDEEAGTAPVSTHQSLYIAKLLLHSATGPSLLQNISLKEEMI